MAVSAAAAAGAAARLTEAEEAAAGCWCDFALRSTATASLSPFGGGFGGLPLGAGTGRGSPLDDMRGQQRVERRSRRLLYARGMRMRIKGRVQRVIKEAIAASRWVEVGGGGGSGAIGHALIMWMICL